MTNFVNHIWEKKNNKLTPINYNYKKRKMDQTKKSQINENGSFYIFDSKKFMIYKNRLFGKIVDYEIDTKYAYQVDEKEDILILSSLLNVFSRNPFFPCQPDLPAETLIFLFLEIISAISLNE